MKKGSASESNKNETKDRQTVEDERSSGLPAEPFVDPDEEIRLTS